MNEYKVNIFGDHNETVRADYVHDTESLLRFFTDEGKEVAVFFKWQYWKFIGKPIEPVDVFGGKPCSQRIDRGFRRKSNGNTTK